MGYRDLREWLTKVDEMGQLLRVDGVDWDLELGAITWLSGEREKGPALLFDHIKGSPPGYRLLANHGHSLDMVALTLGLPLGLSQKEYAQIWAERWKSIKPTPPIYVDDGPVMENVQRGDEVDILKFPAPKWYEKDGGRYIGTNSATITRDPDDDWINLGTYRIMVHDRNHVSFYVDEVRHAFIQREKYFSRGEPCPVAISLGHDPLLFMLSSIALPSGVSEYDYAGAIRGRPIEVIKGPITGLPIPAYSEIVLEGIARPGETRWEGPFGEWSGYYASVRTQMPVIEVQAIYHRNDPIILGTAPVRAPKKGQTVYGFMRKVLMFEELAKAGVPDVTDIGYFANVGPGQLVAVAIKQRYPGHARQAGMVAAASRAIGPQGRYVVVVDDDINVNDLGEVIWAMCTRSDPSQDIEIIRRCWSGPLDPAIKPEEKGFNSRAIIDACRPWEWRDRFPEVVSPSPVLRSQTTEKWGKFLGLEGGSK